MPKNCSADIEAVIAHIDNVFTMGTSQEIQDIKELFGMGDVTHLDDVASTCACCKLCDLCAGTNTSGTQQSVRYSLIGKACSHTLGQMPCFSSLAMQSR